MADALRNGAGGKSAGVRRPIRLAFVGTGNWARRYHLPSLKHIRDTRPDGWDVRLHGIYGISREEAEQLAEQYAFGRVYSRLEEILDDPDIDAMAIVIAPEAARDVLRKLLVRNVPLFTEKPPGADLAQARELAERVLVPNVVGFNRRYGALNNAFKDYLGRLDGIVKVTGSMYRRNRMEPHFVLHCAIHVINMMEYVFGPIVSLHNERNIQIGGPAWKAQVRFRCGLTGELVFAPYSDRHWEGIEVQAEGQMVVLHSPHNDGPGEITVRRTGTAAQDGEVLARSGQLIPILEEGYVYEHLDLYAIMASGGSSRSNFENSLNTMRVAEAMEAGEDFAVVPP